MNAKHLALADVGQANNGHKGMSYKIVPLKHLNLTTIVVAWDTEVFPDTADDPELYITDQFFDLQDKEAPVEPFDNSSYWKQISFTKRKSMFKKYGTHHSLFLDFVTPYSMCAGKVYTVAIPCRSVDYVTPSNGDEREYVVFQNQDLQVIQGRGWSEARGKQFRKESFRLPAGALYYHLKEFFTVAMYSRYLSNKVYTDIGFEFK